MPLETLKKRAEFLRVRGGARWSSPSATLETRMRQHPDQALAVPRFGFTVTKKLGGAVDRNRIRRRLKAAVMELAAEHARLGHDYVLIAKPLALSRPYDELKKDLEVAFHRVHHARPAKRPRPPTGTTR
ncbi:MAG: ribonuclease P protein component [Hyphomicrobiaceae bacterium]|nr:ribonuclease P protein component [Hyphomicrobiaceae bacterium]